MTPTTTKTATFALMSVPHGADLSVPECGVTVEIPLDDLKGPMSSDVLYRRYLHPALEAIRGKFRTHAGEVN